MLVQQIKPMDDCFDGSFMKEVILDEPVSREFIDHLGTAGDLQYYGSFSRPFYRVDVPDKFIIKGIEARSTLRLILSRTDTDKACEEFKQLVAGFARTADSPVADSQKA